MLKLDPPYQIIHAGGEVGLHIATLVVTKESETEDGKYAIETHSHPVVSRVSKVHNTIGEAGKMYSEGEYSEGIVWNTISVAVLFDSPILLILPPLIKACTNHPVGGT